ncbi:MAG: rhodanese-like domain-containing protein [Nitrospirae bacterium]|nr:rhodanese-like domain-containing protein [Nitrospirota bacterium]
MEKGLKILNGKLLCSLLGLLFVLASAIPAFANGDDLAAKIDAVVSKGPESGNFFTVADEVNSWIKMKKTDFVVLDVRVGDNSHNAYKAAHIPGAIYIPYNEIFKPENLKKLPRDKKIILVCHIGATEILPVVSLRMLGYDAYAMLLGMSAWQKDYPAAGFTRGLLDAANTKDYPLEGESVKSAPAENKDQAPPSGGYGAPSGGYGAPSGGYGAPSGGYGK